jgi:1-acyl-sn-glycerol-3-phosphate acyltransferase
VATAVFFVVGGMASPLLWVVWKVSCGKLPSESGQRILRGLFRFYVWWMKITGMLRIGVGGFDGIQDLRGTIFVSNHPALLDAVFLLAHLPPSACVMRAGLLRNPILSGSSLAAGYVTNDSGPGFVRQGIQKILAGENLLVFPEGTRTVSPPVNGFKNGFALVAVRTGAPVRALVVDYHGSHLTKGVSLFTPADVPLRFRIRVGSGFEAGPGESAPEFSRRIESWFREELGGRTDR